MTEADRATGNLALSYWYNGGFKPFTIEEARGYYDQVDPNFISLLGQSTGKIEQSRVRQALTSLALQDGPNYPTREEFLGALSGVSGFTPFSFEFAKEAIVGAGNVSGELFSIGGGLLKNAVPVLALAALIFYAKPIMAALKRAKLA